ncbi:salt tolerance receptor-like cytoplasmic kinase 1 [Phragmites australis]|uniref:salt tolerance receptor-like cytoplasmic kinase 1 n=1 Tax=Phragmites australis TaxID=29695 RepID=UPI002D797A5F|nr:salt tolerance receptor-like cytoplasmic kinase 1 [Phragmites australis]
MLLHRHGLLCCVCGGSATATVTTGGRGASVDAADQSSAKNPTGKMAATAIGTARQLTWAQVEAMTGGFTSAVVGEGGFSTVYLARLAGSLAAVKVHRSSERLHRAFRQELEALLRVRHPHIVRLLAFCDQRDEGVLVLEFAPNGNLHDQLHGGGKGAGSMPWVRRVSVALQVARALEYLHERCEPQVVHGDVKASNVLLDAAMGARLCDFGSARAGFSAAVHPRPRPSALSVLGTPGYVDPHYLRSGVVTKKSDVYSFGVLLLELLTGVQAFCDGRLLTAAVTPKINAVGSCDVGKLVDQRLGCKYDAGEAAVLVALAAACVRENPSLRPSMADVVRTLEQNGQASISSVGRRSDGVRKL